MGVAIPWTDNNSSFVWEVRILPHSPKLRIYIMEKRHIKNLQALSDGLKKLPKTYKNFDMFDYSTCELNAPIGSDPECGTTACIAGHGPMLGIGRHYYTTHKNIRHFDWEKYVSKTFGICHFMAAWHELFSPVLEGTLQDAIERLDNFLLIERVNG